MRSLTRSLPPIVCMGSPTDVMRLYELAYCCRAYAALDSYDAATVALREATADCVDPDDPTQLGPLFVWLRKWGCRQFVIEDENLSRESLNAWWEDWRDEVPPNDRTLDMIGDEAVNSIAAAYEDLRTRQASWQRKQTGTFRWNFGPAGAAKALYAIRPTACSPWDDPIRTRLELPETGDGYRRHLLRSRTELAEAVADLGPDADASELPVLVNRPQSSPVKLVDEHDWARYTRGFEPPAPAELARWAQWAQAETEHD